MVAPSSIDVGAINENFVQLQAAVAKLSEGQQKLAAAQNTATSRIDELKADVGQVQRWAKQVSDQELKRAGSWTLRLPPGRWAVWLYGQKSPTYHSGDLLVFGCGVVGLGAIAVSAYKGAEVIAVDIETMKLDKAGVMGAEHLVNSKEENLNEKVRQLTFGEGPDVVIEAVGLPQTFIAAVDLVCFADRKSVV